MCYCRHFRKMVSFRDIRIRTDKKFLALVGVKWEEEGAMKVIPHFAPFSPFASSDGNKGPY